MGSLSLLQGIFQTQELNRGLLHCRRILYQLTYQFSSVQSLSRVWLFVTPWTAACQASLSITDSRSLLKLVSSSSRWSHPAISSSVVPFSSGPQSFPASASFPITELSGSPNGPFTLNCPELEGVVVVFVWVSFTLLVAHSFLRHPFSILVPGIPELFCPLTLYANKTVAFHLISNLNACTVGSLLRGRKTVTKLTVTQLGLYF